jgi:hypothetical protein
MLDRADRASSEEVGKVLSPEFMVRASTDEQASALRDHLGTRAVVMLYTQRCSACREAIDHYLARRATGRGETGVPFLVLSFEENAHRPHGLSDAQFLRAAQEKRDTLFDTGLTPTFWLFDDHGAVLKRQIGYSKVEMDALLDGPTPIGLAVIGDQSAGSRNKDGLSSQSP